MISRQRNLKGHIAESISCPNCKSSNYTVISSITRNGKQDLQLRCLDCHAVYSQEASL